MLLSDISIYYRRRAAARRAALFVIARYGEGDLVIFPRDMIRLIANEVWKTREDPIWLDASEQSDLSSSKHIKNDQCKTGFDLRFEYDSHRFSSLASETRRSDND